MQEFFNNLDNFSLFKIFGGLSLCISAVVVFFSGLLKIYISNKWTGKQQKDLEELKHQLKRREKLLDDLTNLIPRLHMATSNRRLDHFAKLWESMLKIKNNFPTLCSIAYTILTKEEVEQLPIDNSKEMKDLISNFDTLSFFKFYSTIVKDIEPSRPFVGTHAWNTFFVYQALHGRLTFLIEDGLKKGKIKFWLDEKAFINQVIGIVVSQSAQSILFDNEMLAYRNLVNHLELEIVNEIDSQVSGHSVAHETIKHAIEISEAFKNLKT